MTKASAPITEADLVAFADGRLEQQRVAAVTAWFELPENAKDRVRVEQWRRQTELLRAVLDPVLAEPVSPGWTDALRRTPSRRWFVPAAAAAIFGIALGIGGGWALWGPNQPAARELAEIGLSAHEVFIREVRHPVEVTVADEAHLVNWLSSRLDLAITPPDLSGNGLTLLGGRVVPKDGQPAAQLMYEDASGQRFTLLIARMDTPATTAFRYARLDDSCAYYWMDGTVAYVFAGPDDRELVWRLSRAVYDQLS